MRTGAAKTSPLPSNLQPRGLSREQAAAYLGISPSLFDRLVKGGDLPQAVTLGGRKVWDVRRLDSVFGPRSDLERAADDPWENAAP